MRNTTSGLSAGQSLRNGADAAVVSYAEFKRARRRRERWADANVRAEMDCIYPLRRSAGQAGARPGLYAVPTPVPPGLAAPVQAPHFGDVRTWLMRLLAQAGRACP